MSRVIALDSGPLGALCHTRSTASTMACNLWLEALVAAGHRIAVPEIADYEVRRELTRLNRIKSLRRLDRLSLQLEYYPITTAVMRRASQLWAQSRQAGLPTAPDHALDADVILAAQAEALGARDVVVATTNPIHLSRFVAADLWQNIRP